jgi:hypothetical protein
VTEAHGSGESSQCDLCRRGISWSDLVEHALELWPLPI